MATIVSEAHPNVSDQDESPASCRPPLPIEDPPVRYTSSESAQTHTLASGRSASDDTNVDILIAEYTSLREDERHWIVSIGSFAGLAVLLTGFAISMLYQDSWTEDLPGWTLLLVPAPLAVVVAFILHVSAPMPVNNLYMRTLERRLWQYTQPSEIAGGYVVRHPSSIHLQHLIHSPRAGRLAYRVGQLWMFGFLAIVFVAVLIASFVEAHSRDVNQYAILFAAVVYGFLIVWVMSAISRLEFKGHNDWLDAVDALPSMENVGKRASESRTFSLVLPRPQDLVKVTIPLGAALWAAIAADSQRSVAENLGQTLLFILAFELVFYQGRYLINDLRDSRADASNTVRTRYAWFRDPRGSRIALASVAFRVLVLGVLIVLFPQPAQTATLIGVFVGFAAAVGYEGLRNQSRTDDVAAWRSKPFSRLIYLWVGLGYAIRVAAPIWIVVTAWEPTLAVAVFGLFFGAMFVAMTWGLEATILVRDKAHIANLAPPSVEAKEDEVRSTAKTEELEDSLLAGRAELRFSPFDRVLTYESARGRLWDRFLLTTAIVAPLAAGLVAAQGGAQGRDALYVLAAALCALALPWKAILRSTQIVSMVLVVSAVLAGVAAAEGGAATAIASALPAVVVLSVYFGMFRWNTYRDLNTPSVVLYGALGALRCAAESTLDLLRSTKAKATTGEDSATAVRLVPVTGESNAIVISGDTDRGREEIGSAKWAPQVRERWLRNYAVITVVVESTDDHPAAITLSSVPISSIAKALGEVQTDQSGTVVAQVDLHHDRLNCALDRGGFRYVKITPPANETDGQPGTALWARDSVPTDPSKY